jgi:hypothetical protein
MKPEFMRLRRALTLALATILAAAGITVLSPAGAALAHHNTVSATVSCVASTWTITWSIQNSETDKVETITGSSNPALVPLGTEIAAGGTFIAVETVAEPTGRTLTVTGNWPASNVTVQSSGQVTPYDFAGECAPTEPQVPVEPQVPFEPPAPTEPPAPSYPEQPSYPGEPEEPTDALIVVVAEPCVYSDGAAMGTITTIVTGVASGTPYWVELYAGDESVAYINDIGTGSPVTATFPDLAPGDYHAEFQVYGSPLVTSPSVTIDDCTPTDPVDPIEPVDPVDPVDPLPPVSPPRLVITPVDCSSDVTTPTVSVGVSGLDATLSYQVVLLNAAGVPVASQPLTGVENDDVIFENLLAPASYAAILQVEPGGTTEAETVDLADVVPCLADGGILPTLPLPGEVPPSSNTPDVAPAAVIRTQLPTLALTGAGETERLVSFAVLLFAAGGALMALRLRRRAITA